MKVLNTRSLSNTVNNLNDIFFFKKGIGRSQKMEVALWISERQGKNGSYANMFSPTEEDYKRGVKLFTGESVHSKAAIGHILGEEACRALILLDIQNERVRESLQKAGQGMLEKLDHPDRKTGFYCCGKCSVSYWRHLSAGGLKSNKKELSGGIKILKNFRDGNGRWKRFPFYYTLLALSEIDTPSSEEEITYATPSIRRALKRITVKNIVTERRRLLLERLLEKSR